MTTRDYFLIMKAEGVKSKAKLEAILRGLAQAREVQRARIAKSDWTCQPRGLGLPAGTAAEMRDELPRDWSPN